jgi:hypothetical protein
MTFDEAKAEFMTAVRGLSPHSVAVALGEFTFGVNWRRCPKGHMAEQYARAVVGGPKYIPSHPRLAYIDLQRLARVARAWENKEPMWRHTE